MSRMEGAMLAACAHLFCLGCADTLVRTVQRMSEVTTFRVVFSHSAFEKNVIPGYHHMSSLEVWGLKPKMYCYTCANPRDNLQRSSTTWHQSQFCFERFLTWTFFALDSLTILNTKSSIECRANNLQRVPTASSWKFWKFQEMSRHGSTQRCGLPVRRWTAERSFQVYRWCIDGVENDLEHSDIMVMRRKYSDGK